MENRSTQLTRAGGPRADHQVVSMPWPMSRDDELFGYIDQEVERQNTTLQLIASENFASPAVLEASGSVLTNLSLIHI